MTISCIKLDKLSYSTNSIAMQEPLVLLDNSKDPYKVLGDVRSAKNTS